MPRRPRAATRLLTNAPTPCNECPFPAATLAAPLHAGRNSSTDDESLTRERPQTADPSWHGPCVCSGSICPLPRALSRESRSLLHMLLVFGHLLAASMALGATVATDLRLLSKLSQDKVRIAPPNPFVTRIVMLALLLLYATGGAHRHPGLGERADSPRQPEAAGQDRPASSVLTLERLRAPLRHLPAPGARPAGRRAGTWSTGSVVAVPVATLELPLMFTAFLGVARPWSYTTPMRDILEIAAALFLVVQSAVFIDPGDGGSQRPPRSSRLGRSAGALACRRGQPRPHRARRRRREIVVAASPQQARRRPMRSRPGASSLAARHRAVGARRSRPALRLVRAARGAGAQLDDRRAKLRPAVRRARADHAFRTGDRSPPSARVRPVVHRRGLMTRCAAPPASERRSRADSRPADRRRAAAGADRGDRRERGADRVEVGAGSSAQQRGPASSSIRAPRA